MVTYNGRKILYINKNQHSYSRTKVNQRQIQDQVDFLYEPLVAKEFSSSFTKGVKIDKIYEDQEEAHFQVLFLETDDVDNLLYTFELSKSTNRVKKYSYSASVYNVDLWEEFILVHIEDLDKDIAMSTIASDYNNATSYYAQIGKAYKKKDARLRKREFESLITDLPNYDLVSISSDTFRMSESNYDLYLVDFWFMSCYPCLKAIPILKKLNHLGVESKLKIVSINPVDKDITALKAFVRENEMTYDVFTSSLQVGRSFNGVGTYPVTVLYDKNFNVLTKIIGFSESFEEQLLQYLLD